MVSNNILLAQQSNQSKGVALCPLSNGTPERDMPWIRLTRKKNLYSWIFTILNE